MRYTTCQSKGVARGGGGRVLQLLVLGAIVLATPNHSPYTILLQCNLVLVSIRAFDSEGLTKALRFLPVADLAVAT